MKKPLRIAGIFFLLIIVAVILLPFVFKGKIEGIAKAEINKKLNAKADFKEADISLLRDFPDLSLRLEDLHIIGTGEFEKDTLLSVKGFDLSLNLLSVIKGETIKINAIELDRPRIFALVNKNGNANWDILKPDTSAADTSSETKPFVIHLKKYSIRNGYIVYEDDVSRMSSKIVNLNHEGEGDFTSERFTLQTTTTADEVNFVYGGIPWLNKIRTDVDADLQIDTKSNTYSFQTDKIKLNDLQLGAGGFFQLASADSYNMDIQFKALSTSFKNILSFIPAIYQHDFASVKTNGSLTFDGLVKGPYSAAQIPAYKINLEIKDGFFQYPDLPKAVKNVNLKLSVNNPDGITDHTVIDIPRGHIEMDNNPFDFRLNVKKPLSSLLIDAAAKGKLDLTGITSFVKLEKGTTLKGLLDANVSMKGSAAAAQKQNFDQFYADGTIAVRNFLYRSSDYPGGLQVSNMLMTFNPRNVTVSNMAGSFMNTKFTVNGTINNILPYVIKNQPLNGTINVSADHIDLNKWMGTSASETGGANTSAPFAVPANLDLQLNAKAGSVHYDKLDISNLSGTLRIEDEAVKLSDVKGEALDGTMAINGYYSTKTDKKHPDVSLNYDVKGVDIQKTFFAFNTVQKLMPVGKFLAGTLSSNLDMKGKLGEGMMPDLSSLTGKGNVLLLEGVLNKFQPLEKMANTLNISALQQISVKDIKSYFEFAAGKVLVKPFNMKVKDIDMEIGGLHGLDQSLDYTINMKVPRALMGAKGNSLVNGLVTKVNNKGIPLNIGDKVDLQIKLEGSVTHPVVKTALKQSAASLAQSMKEQSAEFVRTKVEVAKQAAVSAVKDSVASAKKQLLQSAAAQLSKKLSGSTDTSGNKQPAEKSLKETGKGLIKGINPFKKKSAAESETPKE
ncbi:AsmA-like protein [Arcticibacter tournemirensis]|uniref:AsmA family protein n=1 Tax=Arcticibacter tournemirensis TaxID=699437 RepID=A0A5M9H979_9SPHI|nr:AsmA-like C-terminal region-containing protein [Arcticibacter tournemirensis]KAA8482765.1 AsmA family protein [Arcticibacter tournemirensis]TQM51062.1 AsmA-like protein [Arcticibacter tournemirensis]